MWPNVPAMGSSATRSRLPNHHPQLEKARSLQHLTGNIFIGRKREMAILQAGLASVCSGRGHLYLLVGEPGIGKTRIASELARHARQRGAQVLIGRCYEGKGAPSFWPWMQIVRAYSRDRTPQCLMTEMGVGAAAIVQVMPELQAHLPDLAPLPTLDPEQARFRFFDSLTTFLKRASQAQPLILILDDLHWADKPSLLMLQFVAHALDDDALLVLGSYRDIEVGCHHPLSDVLAELARVPRSQRIKLQGLDKSEVHDFLEALTGTPPSETLLNAIYQKTEGNPFFLTEMIHVFVSEGEQSVLSDAHTTRPLPPSVREVIGQRLNKLSEACTHLLTIAAVVGREFSFHVLDQVSDAAHKSLLDALDEAIGARIITEVPQCIGRYSFSHALIRETLYESLSAIRRVQLHQHISQALDVLYHAQPISRLPSHAVPMLAELAYHFCEAAQGEGDIEQAVSYATRAGDQAITYLAYEDAAHHYARALHTLQRKKPTDPMTHCTVLLALGEAQAKAGDTDRARQTFQRAADEARQLDAPQLMARAALGFEGVGVEVGRVDPLLINLLEEVLTVMDDEDSALRSRVLARLARELYFSSASAERRALLSYQAVEMARRVDDPTALVIALNSQHLALWEPGNLATRLAITDEVISLSGRIGDQERVLQGQIDRLTALLEQGDIPAVDAEIASYVQHAQALRQPRYLWTAATLHAMRALLEGQFEAGAHYAQQALALGQRVQGGTAANFFGVQMFSLHRAQGRLQELEHTVQDFVRQYPAVPAWRCALANLYCALGRQAEAQHEFDALAQHDFAELPRDNSWLIGITLLAEVAAFLHDTPRATKLYELLCPYAEHNVVVGDAAACNGSVAHSLGLLATTLGQWKLAEQHFAHALAFNTRMGARPFVAWTQYAYAIMLLSRNQRGDRQHASNLLHAARATAQALGMQELVAKISLPQQTIQDQAQSQPHATNPWAHPCGPGTHELEASVANVSQAEVNEPEPQHDVNVFRKEGEYWTLVYRGTTCRLKDTKGLQHIARLLRDPYREHHVLDLLEAMGAHEAASRRSNVRPWAESTQRVSGLGDAGTILDAQAKAAYKQRLVELQDELEEGQRFHDMARVANAQAEIDILTEQLAQAVGLGGRNRKVASAVERARLNVTKSIKTALRNIAHNHSALGNHLAMSIKTGRLCSYTPDPTQPVAWNL